MKLDVQRVSDGAWTDLFEGLFLERMFDELARIWPTEIALPPFRIALAPEGNAEPGARKGNKDAVLILLSDETGTASAKLHDQWKAVFACYEKEEQPDKNVYPFPLCPSPLVLQNEFDDQRPRPTTVFFSGNLNANRIGLYLRMLLPNWLPALNLRASIVSKSLQRLIKSCAMPQNFDRRWPSAYIRFTKGFMQGMKPADYTQALANSKIVLCPAGFRSTECFRHFEALRAGCIIISPPLPNTRFYHDSPIIQIDSWNKLPDTLNKLLNDSDLLTTVAEAHRDWWDAVCSPKAVALYVSHQLQGLPPKMKKNAVEK